MKTLTPEEMQQITLTPEEMQQISGGVPQGGGFFPSFVARIVLESLFIDFGAERSQQVTW
jgi:hypothetical protein